MTSCIIAGVALFQAGPPTEFEPTGSYKKRSVHGFELRLSKRALASKKELEPALALLDLRLSEIKRRVPPEALKVLQKVPIWIEKDSPRFPCMCYHPDSGWLKQNGMNPDKAKGVELANLKNFVLWSFDQPLMVLHEFAHGYHDLKFGFDGESILGAFNQAAKEKLYDLVDDYKGNRRKGYATTNQMEYFAELSEALFGYNDFFPFTRPELKAHDPVGYKTVCQAWGVTE